MNASTLVQKLWNYCNILRDDGLSYGNYVEQLTLLLFLKMADEKTRAPFNQPPILDARWSWPALRALDVDPLEVHYRHTLEETGQGSWRDRCDLPQGAEQDPRSGQAEAPDRRPDRQGRLVVTRHRPERRCLRRKACCRRTPRT